MIDFIANVLGVLLGVAAFEFGLFYWRSKRRDRGIRKAGQAGRGEAEGTGRD